MSQEAILTAGLVAIVGVLIALVVLVIKLLRTVRSQSATQASSITQIASDQRQLATVIQPLVKPGPPLACVINHLTFADSFDPDQFALACKRTTIQELQTRLGPMIGDGVSVAVKSIGLTSSSARMTVQLSKNGKQLLDSGLAEIVRHSSGNNLPMIRDVNSKKIIELYKGTPDAKTLTRLAALSTAIIGAAHLISGADISKRLSVIDKKIDLLLAYRRIDQLAKLERIYTAAKELCNTPLNHQKNWELWRLRGELRELRCSWRRELQQQLSRIDDPNSASWFEKMFTPQESMDRTVHEQITEGQLHLGMIEYSLRLEHVLAVVGGTLSEFEGTLVGELDELHGVAGLLESKAKFISGKYSELDVTPTIVGMNSIVREYSALLPENMIPKKIAQQLPVDAKVEGQKHDQK